jgi:hypothetical protein
MASFYCATCGRTTPCATPACNTCQARQRSRQQARQNPSLPFERLRCSTCRRFRPITSYPFRNDGFRTTCCETCKTLRRDRYREQKGEPVSELGQARQARRVIREEKKAKEAWLRRLQGLLWNQEKRIEHRVAYLAFIDQGLFTLYAFRFRLIYYRKAYLGAKSIRYVATIGRGYGRSRT